MQLIELGSEVQYIEIDTSKVPYTFSVKLEVLPGLFAVHIHDLFLPHPLQRRRRLLYRRSVYLCDR